MRAVWPREFGGPEALTAGEAPDPVPGPGQVVVDVAFANITFVETQMRAGLPGPFKPELPMIPGNGVGGVAGGRRVVSGTGGSGGYAERVAVDADALVDVPDGLALDAAVALLADGRTATMPVRAAGVGAGDTALVRPSRPAPDEQRELTRSALAEAAAGRLRPVIGQRFPLERAADAHAAIESRATIGKTLLEVGRSTPGGAADRAGSRR